MFRSMKALIVEDSATSVLILKSVLNLLGVGGIEEVTSGAAAIKAMTEVRFDLVLSDYSLGAGKNGQQVLEEARARSLIDSSTVYFLITAETSREMVMGAVESQPDAYLVKPFTPKNLLNRLTATMKVRREFSEIDDALRHEQFEKVIILCDQKVHESPRYEVQALRLKAEAMLKLKHYEAAASVYRQILRIKELPWAMLGIGKALCLAGQPEEAARQFSDVISRYPEAVEAYDLLAELLESEGDIESAQDTLEKAVNISPRSVLRQVELGRLASKNRSWQRAEEAYRALISLAYDSCHKNPDNYIELANALQVKLDDTRSKESLAALVDVTNILDQVRTEYRGDTSIDFAATVFEAESYAASGKDDIANEKISRAANMYQAFSLADKVNHCNRLIKGLAGTGNYEHALEIVAELDDDHIDCNDLVAEMRSKISHIKEDNRCEDLNKKGIAFYETGRVADAYQLFREASDMADTNDGVILNAIQACLDLVEQDKTPSVDWSSECNSYFKRLAGIGRKDHRFERFNTLKQNFKELSQR